MNNIEPVQLHPHSISEKRGKGWQRRPGVYQVRSFVTQEDYDTLRARAKSYGIAVAAMLRMDIREANKRDRVR